MFTIDVTSDAIGAKLLQLAAALDDTTPVMEQIGEYLVVSTKERFKAGTSPTGDKWAPKSAVTLARSGANKSNRVDKRPLFGPSGSLSSQIFHEASPDRVEVGSNMIYAAVQQMGAAQGEFGAWMGKDKLGRDHFHHLPWGDIPARPFLGLSSEDEAKLLIIINDLLIPAETR